MHHALCVSQYIADIRLEPRINQSINHRAVRTPLTSHHAAAAAAAAGGGGGEIGRGLMRVERDDDARHVGNHQRCSDLNNSQMNDKTRPHCDNLLQYIDIDHTTDRPTDRPP